MYVLGIETSGLEGSIALLKDGVSLGERPLVRTGVRHAQALVLEISQLLREFNLAAANIGLVAVSLGPGSFTGLRVGLVCAKTFAYSTGCQFIGVDTFLAVCHNAPSDVDQLVIIDDAQRDEIAWIEYRRDRSGDWDAVSSIQIVDRDEFLRNVSTNAVVTGPGVVRFDANETSANWLTAIEHRNPKARVIAELALKVFGATAAHDPRRDFWRAKPVYLRKSAAEEKLEKHSPAGP
jgi:tRNA threonylcarbamoyladenosine biosynthesis protein TsaB